MLRAPHPRLTGTFRSWTLDRRAYQRLAVSGALAIAVSSASWGWAVAAPVSVSQPPMMQHQMTGQTRPVYGMTDTPAASLRVALNGLFSEHVYLAARATGAALGGRDDEFKAAAAALDSNSVELSKAIGMAYGPDAEAAFLPLWRSHIGMVVDYTVGKATNDQAKQDKAVNDLVGYTQDLGAFLSGANENLPKDVVAGLVKDHVLTLKDVIDAQAAGNVTQQFTAIRAAGHHMSMIADPIAEATVVKFPDKFQGMMETPGSMPGMTHDQGMSNSGMSGMTMAPAAGQAADIKGFMFQPGTITVKAGTMVTWTNDDAIQHSVTASDGSFDSGLFTQGGTFAHTFDKPGTYMYVCTRHASMHGEVDVTQ